MLSVIELMYKMIFLGTTFTPIETQNCYGAGFWVVLFFPTFSSDMAPFEASPTCCWFGGRVGVALWLEEAELLIFFSRHTLYYYSKTDHSSKPA